MSSAALILAAGGSSRLGRPKQLEPWGDSNLLTHVIRNTEKFGLDEVWVVIGAHADVILDQVDFGSASVVDNPEWEEGIASSLRVGLDAINRLSRCQRVLVVLGDQPGVDPKVVSTLVESADRSDRPVTLPSYRYAAGNPVLVDRSLWPRLMSLEGDEGGRRLWQAHPEWVNEIWFPGLPPRGVDTDQDVVEMRPRRLG